MIRWVVGSVCLLLAAGIAVAGETLSASIDPGIKATLTPDFDIVLVVTPHPGDAWTRLAKRVTGDARNWRVLAERNKLPEILTTDARVEVPLALARPELQRRTLEKLFPDDRVTADGWRHKIVAGRAEGEPLWKIAEWFSGDGARYSAIRRANADLPLTSVRGTVILVPDTLLKPWLRAAPSPTEDPNRRVERRPASSPAISRKANGIEVVAPPKRVDRIERASTSSTPGTSRKVTERPIGNGTSSLRISTDSSREPVERELVVEASRDDHDELQFISDGEKEFAVYRLKRGEALYSSVVSRFTGRVYAKDMNEAIATIVEVNQITDVARLHVNEPIRIPVEMLTPEYLPENNFRRVAYEKSKRDSAKAARRVAAKNLSGIHVILDAGHGGRDVGTVHGDVWESNYVYDVMCRLKQMLEKNTDATVHVTTRSADRGFKISDRDTLENRSDHVVLTNPNYILDDAIVGVNLRWYLANSIFRKAIKDSIPPEKVIFISIHADSLHPSLRGAMAYIPGGRFVQGSFAKRGKIYLARAEVRESPEVEQSEQEALQAEGLSRELAEAIMRSLESSDLAVHSFKPVRENVIRDGKEWVPAIIRYNKVPTRLLLEICNLGNESDRTLVQTRGYRQALAKSISRGIVDFFASRNAPAPAPEIPTLRAAAK